MLGLSLCFAALLSTYVMAWRSLAAGLACLLAWGYGYGILRVNVTTTAGHFIFDCALIGLYAAHFPKRSRQTDGQRRAQLKTWIAVLASWSVLLSLVPSQPILVTLVGLRGAIFFLPLALLSSRLTDQDLSRLSLWVSILNVAVLGMAMAEFKLGLERFYPHNALTVIIYRMHDAGDSFRIPATFTSPAGYGGTMVFSLALLFGRWAQTSLTRFGRIITVSGLAAAFIGVLLCDCRYPFIQASIVIGYTTFTGKFSVKKKAALCALIIGAVSVALSSERLQRFKTLRDTDYVESRVSGSVNRRFVEILLEYPMGNGLGGGGTPMPYFLEAQVKNPITIENTYGSLLAEQGVVGLLLWTCFFVWLFACSTPFVRTPWREGRRVAWLSCLVAISTAFIGVGLFTNVPPFLYLMIGWCSIEPRSKVETRYRLRLRRSTSVALPFSPSRLSVGR
jgi:hypothetical protein